MLKLSDINAEIEKLQGHAEKPNCKVCEQLAWLYTIRDHMAEEKPVAKSVYSPRSEEVDLNIYANQKATGMSPRMVAEAWTSGMENEDGTKGPHWDIDQVKQVMGQYGISGNPWEFYAVLNSIYSDYCKVLKKYGVGNDINLYIDMAKSWINDSDAVKDKATAYYQNVVKH